MKSAIKAYLAAWAVVLAGEFSFFYAQHQSDRKSLESAEKVILSCLGGGGFAIDGVLHLCEIVNTGIDI